MSDHQLYDALGGWVIVIWFALFFVALHFFGKAMDGGDGSQHDGH